MDSDSSEEENIDMLREAADNELFTNYLYNPAERPRKEDVTTQNVLSISKPSVRTYLQTEERLNDLKVTPEFQNFVAKRLTGIIESEVKEVGSSSCVEGKKSDSGGILLFGCSSQYVDCDDNNKEPSMENCHRQIKFRQQQKIDHKEINKRCREAAVSADWVLSRRAIAGWEPSKIGKLEVLTPDEVVFIQGSGTGNNAKGKSHGAVQQDSVTDAEKKEKKRLKRKRRKERLKQEQQNVKMQLSTDEVNLLSTNKRKKKRKQDESVSLIENEQVVKKKKKTEEFLSEVNADKFTCIDKKKKEKRKKQKHMTNLMKKLKL